MDCFPDLDITVDTATVDGATIVYKVTIFETQQQDFAGIPGKDLRFDSDHVFAFRLTPLDGARSSSLIGILQAFGSNPAPDFILTTFQAPIFLSSTSRLYPPGTRLSLKQ